MIYIAYDHHNRIISIVNAKNKEVAKAYWQGADIIPHITKSLDEDFTSLDDHPTGVYPILKTMDMELGEFGRATQKRIVVMKS